MRNSCWSRLAGVLWIVCAAARAQEPGAAPGMAAPGAIAPEPLPVVGEVIDVRVVNVEVVATDRKEKDLSRLGPQDSMSIVAWEGGRLVRISPWQTSREEIGQALDRAMARIEVESLRPGVEVRARRGYLDLSPQTATMMKVESALLFGDLPEAEPLAIRLGAPVRGKNARITEIPVTLDIPASVLTMLPDQGKYAGRAELRLAALDEQGNQSTVPVVPLRLVSPRQPSASSKMRYETKIALRGRANRLVALIYDPLSGKIAAGQVDVAIP